MIIIGNYDKLIEITHWLKDEYDLDWTKDYDFDLVKNDNKTKIIFNFKDKGIAAIVALRYL